MRRKQDTSKWEEIWNDLTPEGRERLVEGDALTFKQDGREVSYKVMRKTNKRIWIAPVRLYLPHEVHITKNKV